MREEKLAFGRGRGRDQRNEWLHRPGTTGDQERMAGETRRGVESCAWACSTKPGVEGYKNFSVDISGIGKKTSV